MHAKWSWAAGELKITLERDGNYVVPVPFALVKDGRDVASGTFVLDGARQEFTAKCPKPDFVSWNRGCGFYGVLAFEASEAKWREEERKRKDGERKRKEKRRKGHPLSCR